MKSNIPTELLIISLICVLAMGGIIVANVFPPPSHPLIPTETISGKTSTGGIQQHDTSSSIPDTPPQKQPTPTHQTPTERSTPSQTSSIDTTESVAPKQAELTKTVTKEYPYKALAEPNDPYYTSTTYPPWALRHIGAPAVWNQTAGSPIVIAVIDTGFALQHEDLASQWYTSAGEQGPTTLSQDAKGKSCTQGADKSTNGCDDDNNGYVDDWRGWNFYGRYTPTADPCAQTGLGTYAPNNNPQAGESGDDIMYRETKTCSAVDSGDPYAALSHGTSTSGLAGASTNNGKGIATLNWNVRIMPLQALGDDGSGWTSTIISAIRYATDNGAQIISMSLGGTDNDPALQAAVDYAYSKNVLIVAAAGNCGTGTEAGCDPAHPGQMMYPALLPHVLAVGASTSADTRASFSSYGPALDLLAPGDGAIISPMIYRPSATMSDKSTFDFTSRYAGELYGTSFATPIAANALSLIKSVRPSYSVDDITAIADGTTTKSSAMTPNGLYSNESGHGLINANSYVAVAKALSATAPATPKLAQTGDYRSEHSYSSSALMSSGCTVTASTYCTIRMTNDTSGADRFLPYQLTNANGQAGWQWTGAILPSNLWSVRAVQGNAQSAPYLLFQK